MSTDLQHTFREGTRVFITGSCEGLNELSEALSHHPEMNVVGRSQSVREGAGALAGGGKGASGARDVSAMLKGIPQDGADALPQPLVDPRAIAFDEKGNLVFKEPPTHMFEIGRFREETMAFPPGVTIKAGQQVPGFAWLRDDGTTACGNWLYSGSWTEAGCQSQRRGTEDPSGLGIYPNWGWSWPALRGWRAVGWK